MLAIMGINLYTVRIVLNALGVEDYGIYNVTAGIVTMLSCVTTVLNSSAQRYYSFYIGLKDNEKVNEVFSVNCLIYLIFSLVVLLLGYTLGIWAVSSQLNIPEVKICEALWIFQFAMFSFIMSLLQVPFVAMLIAYERMNIFAIVSIIEAILKLCFAYSLYHVASYRLIYYGLSLLLIAIVIFCLYLFITKKNVVFCKFRLYKHSHLYREILSFSSWNLFGSVAGVSINQGITILMGVFFGPILCASRAIALQISSAIITFSNNFIIAIKPAMIKSYAEQDYVNLNLLFMFGNKVLFYSMLLICIPLYITMDDIIPLWLGVTTLETIYFSRLIVIYTFIMALNNPITIIMQATAKVREYYLPVESSTLLCIPLTYVFFALGFDASCSFYVMIASIIAAHAMRVYCLKRYYNHVDIKEYLIEIFLKGLSVTVVLIVSVYLVDHFLPVTGLSRIISILIVTFIMILVLAYYMGLNKNERSYIIKFIENRFK